MSGAQLFSKVLGYAVVVGGSAVKVPQIGKVIGSRSSEGLSLASLMLELVAYAITVAFCLSQRFPFSTFGENVFLLLQDVIILCLLLRFRKPNPMSFLGAVASAAAFCAFAAALCLAGVYHSSLPSWASPVAVLTFLQACTIPIFTASKVPQIALNWSSGSTGQLSLVTYACNLAGSLARIFTTMQELASPVILAGFVLGAALNGIITLQILYYWSADKRSHAKAKAKDAVKNAAKKTQ